MAYRSNFLLPVEVLPCLFLGLVLEKRTAADRAGQLQSFGNLTVTGEASYRLPVRRL